MEEFGDSIKKRKKKVNRQLYDEDRERKLREDEEKP